MKNKERGFTLIEIMVVIAIMATTMGLTIGFLGGGFDRDAKKETAHLAATIRFAYHAAISGHVPTRIVFDLNENQYWVEVGSGNETLPATSKDQKKEEPPPDQEKALSPEGAAPQAPPAFVAADEDIVRRVTLPKAVKFRDVQTAHDDAPVTTGKATLYFFPTGFTEEAVIHFSNEEATSNYSVIVSPLTGTSRIEKDYVELEKTTEE